MSEPVYFTESVCTAAVVCDCGKAHFCCKPDCDGNHCKQCVDCLNKETDALKAEIAALEEKNKADALEIKALDAERARLESEIKEKNEELADVMLERLELDRKLGKSGPKQ